ncbi:MAG: hypothetical protein RIT45_4267 [Pseudomonadota bacterium]|jgi:phosphoserine phosphatase
MSTSTPASLPAFSPTAASAVVAAIDATVAGERIFADCDGTLWYGDVGDDFVRLAGAQPALFPRCTTADRDFAAYAARVDRDYEGACLQSALLARGVDATAVKDALRAALAPTLRPRRWLLDAMLAAADRGVVLWAVSASGRLAVEVGLELLGVRDRFGIIAVDVDDEGPVAPWPIGFGKVHACRAAGLPAPAVAVGDSIWDGPMLADARHGFRLQKPADDADFDRAADELRGAR